MIYGNAKVHIFFHTTFPTHDADHRVQSVRLLSIAFIYLISDRANNHATMN